MWKARKSNEMRMKEVCMCVGEGRRKSFWNLIVRKEGCRLFNNDDPIALHLPCVSIYTCIKLIHTTDYLVVVYIRAAFTFYCNMLMGEYLSCSTFNPASPSFSSSSCRLISHHLRIIWAITALFGCFSSKYWISKCVVWEGNIQSYSFERVNQESHHWEDAVVCLSNLATVSKKGNAWQIMSFWTAEQVAIRWVLKVKRNVCSTQSY